MHISLLRYHAHRDLHSFPTRRSSDLVSRGQTTSLRSSFSATEAARWMRSCIAPDAIVPSVPIEQGQMTYASKEERKDRKSTRLNSSHLGISYAVFCLKKKTNI